MRDITKLANVNLASVNYHFGSKDELINAVFIHTVEPLIQAMNNNLSILQQQTEISKDILEISLRALVNSALARSREIKSGGGIFMRLLNRAYSDPEAKVRNYIVKHYAKTVTGYVELFAKVLVDIPAEQLYWRTYFMLGSLVFIMSSETTLRNIAQRDYRFNASDEAIVEYLVTFLAAGFRA